MSDPFLTYKRVATRGEMAQQIALDTIEEHTLARKGREEEPWDAQDTERMERLATLMIGPHKAVVTPHVLRAYPQMAALLDRKVGRIITREMHVDENQGSHGLIEAIDGTQYPWDSKHVCRNRSHATIGAQFVFRVSDDGQAIELDQLDKPAPQAVGQA